MDFIQSLNMVNFDNLKQFANLRCNALRETHKIEWREGLYTL